MALRMERSMSATMRAPPCAFQLVEEGSHDAWSLVACGRISQNSSSADEHSEQWVACVSWRGSSSANRCGLSPLRGGRNHR
jgi:hypothetical protein